MPTLPRIRILAVDISLSMISRTNCINTRSCQNCPCQNVRYWVLRPTTKQFYRASYSSRSKQPFRVDLVNWIVVFHLVKVIPSPFLNRVSIYPLAPTRHGFVAATPRNPLRFCGVCRASMNNDPMRSGKNPGREF